MKSNPRFHQIINLAKSNIASLILDVAGINYTIIDADGNYITANNSTLSILKEYQLNSDNAAIIDPVSWQDCQLVMEARQRTIKEEKFNDKYFLSVKQPLIYNDECLGILVVSLDITERKKADQIKADFIRNMNHDIRTPLAGIYSMARMLHDDEIDPGKQACLDDIVKSSERLSALLSQVLEMTSSGKDYPVENKPYSIVDIIDEATELMIAAIKAKGLELTVDCPDIIVNSDKFRMSKILLTLLSNAVKFTQQGTIRVVAKAEPKFKLIVEDTGIGIPQDKFDFIFDKFTKLKPSGESQVFTGAGIGLHLARQFAREIGGDIFVESELGKGSKFIFAEL